MSGRTVGRTSVDPRGGSAEHTVPARFVVLERHSPAQVAAAVADLTERLTASARSRVEVADGWRPASPDGIAICAGRVVTAEQAASAVLAAVHGAGLVVDVSGAERDVIDRLCDDLRHLGELDHRVEPSAAASLDDVQEQLLGLLLGGATLGLAARTLHLSRRTADRRLAAARQALGADTTSEAVATARRLGVRAVSPRP